ncbi:MAG TPA: NUDIX hydrolase [Stellaceae bacterium]|nr:NUDIX hydrolase [Stellaceae bacterium]
MSSGERQVYPDRPVLAALAVVRRGDRVLLAQRSMGPGIGRWGFPGGMQELGETIEACAARELLEETGIDAAPCHVLTALNTIRCDDAGRVRTHFTLVAVLLDWRQGEGEPIEDATALGWFNLDEAAALDSFPDALPVMRLALVG